MRNLKLINYSTLQNLIKHFDYCNAEHKNPNKDRQNLEFFSEIVHNGIYLQKNVTFNGVVTTNFL